MFSAPTRAVVIAWLVSRALDVDCHSTDVVMAMDPATWDGSGGTAARMPHHKRRPPSRPQRSGLEDDPDRVSALAFQVLHRLDGIGEGQDLADRLGEIEALQTGQSEELTDVLG